MQAVLIVLLYGGALWLALMALGYLRPRGLTAAWGQSPHKVDPRSPHAILDAGLTIGDQPVALPPVARERVYRNAMALAARKPHLLFAIGRVVAFLKPATPEEVDAAIDAAVASVEGGAIDPGAGRIGAWHPVAVRGFLEALPGETRHFFYLPDGWNWPWQFLAYANAGSQRRPQAGDLSLGLVAIDPAAFEASKPRTDDRNRQVEVRIEGREHVVDRIALRVEGDAGDAVRLRERIAIVTAGFAGGLLGEPLPEGVIFAIRRGHEMQHELANGHLTYLHRIDRPYRTEGDRCLATVELMRDGP